MCGLRVILAVRVTLLTSGNTRYNSSFFLRTKKKEENQVYRSLFSFLLYLNPALHELHRSDWLLILD